MNYRISALPKYDTYRVQASHSASYDGQAMLSFALSNVCTEYKYKELAVNFNCMYSV